VTEILLHDEIGYFGITSKAFAEVLAGVSTPKITVRVNSPGGDVFDGMAIYNSLKSYKGVRKKEPVTLVLISEDGTWHRPLTILERAALQGFDATLDGAPLTLTGKNRSCWSVRIGDAVPPPAAEAMAEQFLLTLVYADAGAFALSSGGGVWVREEARAMWRAEHGAVMQ
jgi:hypothetical protein